MCIFIALNFTFPKTKNQGPHKIFIFFIILIGERQRHRFENLYDEYETPVDIFGNNGELSK